MKKNQQGRSMVEMLAVLAVIGVLSLGGIHGYSIAIDRHKANTLLDAVNKYASLISTICNTVHKTPDSGLTNIENCSTRTPGFVSFENAKLGDFSDLIYRKKVTFLNIKHDEKNLNGSNIVSVELQLQSKRICSIIKTTTATKDGCTETKKPFSINLEFANN